LILNKNDRTFFFLKIFTLDRNCFLIKSIWLSSIYLFFCIEFPT